MKTLGDRIDRMQAGTDARAEVDRIVTEARSGFRMAIGLRALSFGTGRDAATALLR